MPKSNLANKINALVYEKKRGNRHIEKAAENMGIVKKHINENGLLKK